MVIVIDRGDIDLPPRRTRHGGAGRRGGGSAERATRLLDDGGEMLEMAPGESVSYTFTGPGEHLPHVMATGMEGDAERLGLVLLRPTEAPVRAEVADLTHDLGVVPEFTPPPHGRVLVTPQVYVHRTVEL